jgi:hypothetical protein
MDALLFRAARTHGFVGWIVLSGATTSAPICPACALYPAQTALATSSPAPAEDTWRLEIHLSGGFAGLNRELQLSSTGELSAHDRRRDTHVTARVSADEISKIGSLIPVAPASPSRKTGCADCFLYDLTLHVRGRSVVVRTDDVSLGGSDIEPLVRNLVALLDRAMTGRLNVQGQRQ